MNYTLIVWLDIPDFAENGIEVVNLESDTPFPSFRKGDYFDPGPWEARVDSGYRAIVTDVEYTILGDSTPPEIVQYVQARIETTIEKDRREAEQSDS